MNKKTNLIGKLSLKKTRKIAKDVLKKEGYNNIKEFDDNILTGETKEGLLTHKTAFLFYQKSLSGTNVNLEELKRQIPLVLVKFKPNLLILISNQTVSGSVENELRERFSISILSRDQFSDLIDSHFPNYWTYQNFDLVSYEKYFLEEMVEKSALLNIQGLESRVQRLLNIYIKPRIYEITDDLESNNVQLNKVHEIDILRSKKSCIIEGETGSGKSTLLKEIGRLQIKEQSDLKTLPVFISPLLLFNSGFSVETATFKLLKDRVDGNWDEIKKSYKLMLLVDNIDEFNNGDQEKIIKELNNLTQSSQVRYILSTRSIETNKLSSLCKDVQFFQIRKFNDTQIKEFASRFFKDEGLASNLLSALEDNRILERLPLTPLSLSLIALVYEKENYEIPATISDIYDNFNQLILGKITANKRFELINFSFRERILSTYALYLLQENKLKPLKKKEFLIHFKEYFKDKSSMVAIEVIEEFLDYFIDNSGILNIIEDEYVQFSHKSFLEYYASLEIFKHQRELETELIQKFLDLNWQNVSVFYAGQSKDMPRFLNEILKVVKSSSKLEQHNSAITGLGYLLQALYQTDNTLRQEAVKIALDQSLIVHKIYQQISADGDILLFKKMRLPALSIFNMYFFYLNFLSSTLIEPLSLAFKDLWNRYLKENDTTTGYQLLNIAAIFHSKRLSDSSYLNQLLDNSNILKDPYLVTIAEFSLYFDSTEDHKEIKKKLHKAYNRMGDVTKKLLSTPASKLRFSNLDMIESNKRVSLITEGPTDVEILETAYFVLTNGQHPYWKAKPAGIQSGGAIEVKYTLDKSKPLSGKDTVFIGIFDNDTEGRNQFNGLNHNYSYFKNYKRVKKMDGAEIYGVKIPVPKFREIYTEQENENYYVAIEHYFEDDLLDEFGLIKNTGIPNIFKIKSTKSLKSKFSKHIKSIDKPEVFKHFIPLFETIDDIAQVSIDYYSNI
jgi:hypothetical protein